MRLPFKGLYKLNQEFGVNPQYYSQFLVMYPDGQRKPMSGHNGLDFATPHRTEVIAPHQGSIIEATLDQKGYGYYVKIENELEGSVLAHMDEVNVQVGYQLKEGEHIGWSDNTGYSTGAHLHWGWYKKPRNRNNGIAGFEDQTAELAKNGIIIKLNELPEVLTYQGGADISGQLYTKEQYDACMNDREKFWKERDEALLKLNNLKAEYESVMAVLSEFRAMGYNTVDEVTKALNQKDQDMVGIKQQLVTALQRNKTLADLLAQKDHEDSTAIEDGLSAFEEVKQLRNDLAMVTKAVGASKPEALEICSKAGFFKDLAEKWIRKLEYDHKAKTEQKVAQGNKTDISLTKLLLNIFEL